MKGNASRSVKVDLVKISQKQVRPIRYAAKVHRHALLNFPFSIKIVNLENPIKSSPIKNYEHGNCGEHIRNTVQYFVFGNEKTQIIITERNQNSTRNWSQLSKDCCLGNGILTAILQVFFMLRNPKCETIETNENVNYFRFSHGDIQYTIFYYYFILFL